MTDAVGDVSPPPRHYLLFTMNLHVYVLSPPTQRLSFEILLKHHRYALAYNMYSSTKTRNERSLCVLSHQWVLNLLTRVWGPELDNMLLWYHLRILWNLITLQMIKILLMWTKEKFTLLILPHHLKLTWQNINIICNSIFLWGSAFNCHNNSILDKKYMKLYTNI